MERKEFLETFIELADSGAPAIQYRKRLRIKLNTLGTHVKNLTAYRNELGEIKRVEEYKLEQQREQGSRDATRQRQLESRLREREVERLDTDDSSGQSDDSENSSARWEDDGGTVDTDTGEAPSEQEPDTEDL